MYILFSRVVFNVLFMQSVAYCDEATDEAYIRLNKHAPDTQ